jgi:histidyl-tRNA synthetase
MIRGTRVLTGSDAKLHGDVVASIRGTLTGLGFGEVILPSLWDQETFIQKAGPEIISQMWAFEDKGHRPVCLHP